MDIKEILEDQKDLEEKQNRTIKSKENLQSLLSSLIDLDIVKLECIEENEGFTYITFRSLDEKRLYESQKIANDVTSLILILIAWITITLAIL